MRKVTLAAFVLAMCVMAMAVASLFPDSSFPVLHKVILIGFGFMVGAVIQKQFVKN